MTCSSRSSTRISRLLSSGWDGFARRRWNGRPRARRRSFRSGSNDRCRRLVKPRHAAASGRPGAARDGEESATAHALAGIGLRTVIIGAPIYQMLGARRFADVYNRQMRWAVIRRQNELPGFLAEPLSLSVFVALAAAFAAPLIGWSGLAAFLATLAF